MRCFPYAQFERPLFMENLNTAFAFCGEKHFHDMMLFTFCCIVYSSCAVVQGNYEQLTHVVRFYLTVQGLGEN